MDSRREKVALAFAQKHHSELASLLKGLQHSDRKHYLDGLSDVYRDYERISKLKDRDPDRYRVSLRIWTLNSRIRLAQARYTMDRSAELKEQILTQMRERNKARIQLHELDRKRLAARLEKLDEQIATLKNRDESRVEAEFERQQRAVGARARSSKSRKTSSVDGTTSNVRNVSDRKVTPKKTTQKKPSRSVK